MTRLVLVVIVLLLAVGYVGFFLTNPDARVDLTVFQTGYRGVHLAVVVAVSLAVGALAIALIAVVEGTVTRLDNRRLRREIHRLETEMNYLRTEPPARRVEPDAIEEPHRAGVPQRVRGAGPQPPSAPVYEPDTSEDPDEDVYSGGRAV